MVEICSLISICVALVIGCVCEYAQTKAGNAITGENIDGYNISSDILGYNTKICGDEISIIRINDISVAPSRINVCGRIQCNVKNYDELESYENETNRFDDYEMGSSKQDAANTVAEAGMELYYLTDVAGGEDVILLYTATVSFSGDLISFEIIDVE